MVRLRPREFRCIRETFRALHVDPLASTEAAQFIPRAGTSSGIAVAIIFPISICVFGGG